jgi:hypothetical protein
LTDLVGWRYRRHIPEIVPSYIAKVTRAEKHIADLETEIARYAACKPYAVREAIEGKKKVHRLVFTSHPANTDIPLIAADAIHNLRFALDHLMAALVPNKQRRSAMFPVYFQGVWEAAPPRENQERTKSRERWASHTANVQPGALTLLKALQPSDDAGNRIDVSNIQVLHRLSVRDRHETLPVVAVGLSAVTLCWERPDKRIEIGRGRTRAGHFLQNNACLDIPNYAVNVKIEGTPTVGITITGKDRHVELPDILRRCVGLLNLVLPEFSLYVVR